jgi:hypothetical protein
VRALVISLENVSAIPDASVLYTCTFRLAATAPSGRFAVAIDDTGASDSVGNYVPAIGLEGRIEVLGGAGSRALTTIDQPGGPLLCSSGPDDGMPCPESHRCSRGLCIIAQGICDSADDNGLLCDCPGGRCVRADDGSTCVGGSADGAACETDSNCAGAGACVATQKLCQSGAARGMPCLNDGHCLESDCAASRGLCIGGDFARYGCVTDGDCSRGECSSLDDPLHPAGVDPTPEARSTDSSDGCAIAPTSSGNGWLIALGVAVLLVMRRGASAAGGRRSLGAENGMRSSGSARM